jgi:acetyltransferase-like isoleucine patch superfamily enzyme
MIEFVKQFLKQQIARIKCVDKLVFGYNARLGRNVIFEGKNYLGSMSVLSDSTIGRMTYISSNCIVSNLKIGRYCSIAPGVKIGLGRHPLNEFYSTHPSFYRSNSLCGPGYTERNLYIDLVPTVIGNDVWIGANAVILDGINIADGAVIAAGAVVTKNVEPYAVVGGVPAKLLKYRFDVKTIETLLESRWWYKDEHVIKFALNSSNHLKSFIRKLNEK